jgi:hypothetical protein
MLSGKAQSHRRTKTANWFGLLFALALVFGCLLYALPAALSGNVLFATKIINERPAQAILYHDGESAVFEPGDPEYDLLVDAAYETLGAQMGFNEWGWSDERYEQARAEGTALELIYTDPVKLPGNRMDIADPTRLFFPLYVFGHEGEVVFRGGQEEYWGLPIRVDSLDRVRTVAADIVSTQ